MDVAFDATADGRTIKLLNVIDEFTRPALAIHVDRATNTDGVVNVLDHLALLRGAPCYALFGNGPELVAHAVNHLVPIQRHRFTVHRSRLTLAKRRDRVVQRPPARRAAQLLALRLPARSPRHHQKAVAATTTPTDPTPPTTDSPQPSPPYSRPRPTNPKPHSDETTKRVPFSRSQTCPAALARPRIKQALGTGPRIRQRVVIEWISGYFRRRLTPVVYMPVLVQARC